MVVKVIEVIIIRTVAIRALTVVIVVGVVILY